MTDEGQSWPPVKDGANEGGGESQATESSSVPNNSSNQANINLQYLSRLPRLLFSRRWWWTTLIVIAGMALLARLGFWQLDRLEQRRASNAQLLQQLNSAPLDINSEPLPLNVAELEDRQAIVAGTFDYNSQVLLTQQNWQGRPGVHLITPLIIDDLDAAVLVDRGWISAGQAETGDFAIYNDDDSAFVEGVIKLSDSISSEVKEQSEPKAEWYRVDIEGIEAQLPYSLLPVYLEWLPNDSDLELPYRAEREIDLSEGSHLSYAIQWFLFATVLAVGYMALILQREKR